MVSEQERWLLWSPVVLGLGSLAYLTRHAEPSPMWIGLPITLLLALRWRRARRWRWPIIAALLFSLGFFLAQWQTQRIATVMLTDDVRFRPVTGTIAGMSQKSKALQIVLSNVVIDGLDASKTPQRVRLSLRGKKLPELHIGDRIRLRAGLMPPGGPIFPGGFDFARYFYFQGIGAVGYGVPPVTVLEVAANNHSNWQADWQDWRQRLTARISASLPQPAGSIAAALITGDQNGIPEDVQNVMRASNLSHILSISGMHMAIVAGIMFFACRWLLVRLPRVALSPRSKKYAALMAMVACLGYLAVADFPVAAVRSFVMVALLLLAVLLDRQVMPMRSLAMAAMLILLVAPADVLSPSFQLSFSATMALIAFYEIYRQHAPEQLRERSLLFRQLMLLVGISLTSLVAEYATAPIVLYHFHKVSFYGVLANMLVVPAVSYLVMPGMLIALALWPLGMESFGFTMMEWGIDWMLHIGSWVASLPYATMQVPQVPVYSVMMSVFGLLWLCLWRTRLRWLGIALTLLGLSFQWQGDMPDWLVHRDRKTIAMRIDGEMRMIRGSGRGFTAELWSQAMARENFTPIKPVRGSSYECDSDWCRIKADGQHYALLTRWSGKEQACASGMQVLSPWYRLSKSDCPSLLFDRETLWRNGAHWGWATKGDLGSTRQVQGNRPWSSLPKPSEAMPDYSAAVKGIGSIR